MKKVLEFESTSKPNSSLKFEQYRCILDLTSRLIENPELLTEKLEKRPTISSDAAVVLVVVLSLLSGSPVLSIKKLIRKSADLISLS